MTEHSNKIPFPVVGMGASAGGLNAFKKFFQAIPSDCNIAFILVQHLEPHHDSMMVELLAQYTSMTVLQVEQGMSLTPNTIFLIPPNTYLQIENGHLSLTETSVQHGVRLPIDFLFVSLAKELKEQAIGIILSGTGTDGTLGLRAIKTAGGIILVQEPNSTQYDGMPISAISTGLVDFVLPIEKMPTALLSYLNESETYIDESLIEQNQSDELQIILNLILIETNHDFRCYKKGTLRRRIHRRMSLCQADSYTAYIKFLKDNPEEIKILLRDLLIGVTAFFRDSIAWQELESLVLTPLIKEKKTYDALRIWVAGCSSGEEAYSIAILLKEIETRLNKKLTIQIFASDIDAAALNIARAAIYPETISIDLTEERLHNFFTYQNGQYSVIKQIRELVVFTKHNFIQDPPFSKLDLVCCRNLLIYLNADIQKDIISLFHFSLNKHGYLFLGSSESIAQQEDLFQSISEKVRIFKRLDGNRKRYAPMGFPLITDSKGRNMVNSLLTSSDNRTMATNKLAQEILLHEYVPASVIVNRKYEVVYFHGEVSRYFQVTSGEPTRDIRDMARSHLRTKLRRALQRCIHEQTIVKVTCRNDDLNNSWLDITVRPVNFPVSAEGLIVVSLTEQTVAIKHTVPITDNELGEIKQLELELDNTREDLRITVEELETTNEELRTANEEMLSINEELQSTNEELETSKEELQSLNEEFSTLNHQLQEKLQELEASHNDMVNLFESTNVATLFLDNEFRIRRFTPAVKQLFRLISTDIGRHITDIRGCFDNCSLLKSAEWVLKNLQAIEKDIQTEQGSFFICRILPYRTLNHHIDGVTLTFFDITKIKQTEIARRDSEERLKLFIEHSPVSLAMFDKEMRYLAVSSRWLKDYCLDKQDSIIGKSHYQVFPTIPEHWKVFHERGLEGESLEATEDCFLRPDGVMQWLRWKIKPWYSDNKVGGIIIFTEDITDSKLITMQLQDSENRFRLFMDNSPAIAWIKDEYGCYVYTSGTFEKRFGIKLEDSIGKTDFQLWPPQIANEFHDNDLMVLSIGKCLNTIEKTYSMDGECYYWDSYKFLLEDNQNKRYVAGIGVDITEKQRIQTELAEISQKIAEEKDILQAVMNGAKNFHLVYLDTEFNFVCVNKTYADTCGYTPEQMIGKNHFELYPNPDNQRVFIRVRDTGEVFTASDHAFIFPDQPERGVTYWDWTLTPVRNNNHQIQGLVFALHETTERKLAEDKLRLAAQVFDNAGEGIMVTDVNKRILAVNKAFSLITGYSKEEILGQRTSILSSGQCSKEFYSNIWHSINQFGQWQGEIWNRRKNQECYPEWLTISPVFDANQQLINYVGIFRDISAIKESQKRLEFLATHDELTKLPNRVLFYDRVTHQIEYAKRHGNGFALLFIDLDDFKIINDSLGHDVGDVLLKEIALRLKNCLRSEDTIARFGGDEFVMIIEDANLDTINATTKRIEQVLSVPIDLIVKTVYISASIGISLYPSDGIDVETLMKNADNAMYRAKESGKATHHFFTGDLELAADERLRLANDLRSAIKNNELFLVYQPKVNIEHGTLVGVEALIRWQHPELGLLAPARFIHIAEKSDLIDSIGQWVINRVFQQIVSWQNAGYIAPKVAINVSVQQFRRCDLSKLMAQLLAQYNLKASQITIELTESALMGDPLLATQILNELRNQGIATSIDDFGTGYSSLAYLRRYKLNELKIDKTFIDEIDVNTDDRAIAHTIINMAQTLGLSVVAEGIETPEQFKMLQELGCQIGQGYLFAEPLLPNDLVMQFFDNQ